MSSDELVGRKRRLSSVDEDDSSEPELAELSKPWNDPSLLEEMGLGVLSDDSPFFEEVTATATDDSSEIEVFTLSSSDDDCTENVEIIEVTEVKQALKKRRLSEPTREPLKQQQVSLAVNKMINSDYDGFAKGSHHKKKHNGKTREDSAPSRCDTVKTKTVNKACNKDSNSDINKTSTEDVCNLNFKLAPVRPLNDAAAGKNYFSLLPEELILGIFRFLDRTSLARCREVSKQFLGVANDESLWTRVDLGGRTINSGALSGVLLRGCLIVRLASACIADPVINFELLPKDFSCNIQYLDLSMTTISPQGLADLLGYCKKLRKLSLENCTVSDEVCKAIARNMYLEVLNLTMCSGILPEGLEFLTTRCKRLLSLNLGWTHLSPTSLDVLARYIPSGLERLNISGCRHNLEDIHVIYILRKCDNMLELDVSDCIDLTERVIDFIVDEVSALEYLAVSRCYSIPLESLKSLKKVESLIYLDLFGLCSETEVKNLRVCLGKTLNQFHFSSVARPTVGVRRTSIWGLRVRD